MRVDGVVWQHSTAYTSRNMLDAAASVCSVAFLHSQDLSVAKQPTHCRLRDN